MKVNICLKYQVGDLLPNIWNYSQKLCTVLCSFLGDDKLSLLSAREQTLQRLLFCYKGIFIVSLP